MVRRTTIALVLVLAAALAAAFSLSPASARPSRAPAAAPPGARTDPGFAPAARASALARARADAPAMARKLGLGDAESLQARSVDRDVNGTEHIRYDRTVKGLEVIGGDLVVHRSVGGAVEGADYAADAALTGVPTRADIPAERAIRVVSGRQDLARGTVGRATLVVWAVSGVPRPAWQVQVRGTGRAGAPVRRVEYVDATSGRYISGWSLIDFADGQGKSLYGGTVPLTTLEKDGAFLLKDPTRGNSTTVDVFNKYDTTSYRAGTVFKDADNTWGNGTTTSRQSAAVDAAYGAAKTWDYYLTTFGRQGIRGDGVGAKSRVHYGKAFDNAFWDDYCFCMTYGDGGKYFRPLVALDVTGHEMTHGITSDTAGLIYIGEPGGLNEATSDIFGTMVEFYAQNAKDPGDYIIGEKVAKARALGTPFLRRMDKPSADGYSFDCWSPTMGMDNKHQDDPHFTSGPANHFFYLLAEGTGTKTIGGKVHSSSSCNGSTLAGIGRDAAAAIWYHALTDYLTSSSGYIDARDATIRAALANDPGNCVAVENAWKAIKVPQGSWTCSGGQRDEGPNALVDNPGFENGTAGWTFGGTAKVTQNLNEGIPHSGHYWAALNARIRANTATVKRTVTVPDSPTARLRFSLLIYAQDPRHSANDTFDVKVGTTSIAHWSGRYANNTYVRRDVSMAAYAGRTVTLTFRGHEDRDGLGTGFMLDDVSLTPR